MSVPAQSAPTPRWDLRAVVIGSLLIAASSTVATAIGGGTNLVLSLVYVWTATSFLVVGLLITERRPGHAVGRLSLALGMLIVVYLALDTWVRSPLAPPGTPIAAWLVTVSDGLWFFLIALLFLLFPTGRLPSPRWRVLVWVTAILAALTFVLEALRSGANAYYPWIENPVPVIAPDLVALWPLPYALTVLCVAAAALSLFARWRHGGAIERTQLKWAAAAASLVGVAMIGYGGGAGPGKYSEIGDLGVGIALGLFPVAIGIAVLRYRLFEIDRIVSRTISYAIITILLVAAYAITVLLLQGPFSSITGGQTIAVAVSTLLAAAAFQPVRSRVQRIVDRRFDRARFDAERTSQAFADRLQTEVEIEAVAGDLRGTVTSALRPDRLGLWLRKAHR